MHGFFSPLLDNTEYVSLVQGINRRLNFQLVNGLTSSQTSFVGAGLISQWKGPSVFLTLNSQSAKKKALDLSTLLPGKEILLFPDADIVPFGAIAQSREVSVQRLKVIHKILGDDSFVLVLPVGALVKKMMPAHVFSESRFSFVVGKRMDITDLKHQLVSFGYERVEVVEGIGQFSARGGILDIFCPVYDAPIRVEFFDDEVDSIRLFDPVSQRSLDKTQQVEIFPAREILFPTNKTEEVLENIKKEFITEKTMLLKLGKKDAYQRLSEKVGEVIEKLEAGFFAESVDNLFSFYYPDGVPFLEYLPQNTLLFLEEPTRQREALFNRLKEETENFLTLQEQGLTLRTQAHNIIAEHDYDKSIMKYTKIGFSLLPKKQELKPSNIVNFSVKTMHVFKGKTNLLLDEIRTLRENGFAIVIFVGTRSRVEKINALFTDNDIFPTILNGLPEALHPGDLVVCEGILENGFEIKAVKLAVMTDMEVFGQAKKSRTVRVSDPQGSKISHFSDLRPGDYVVHTNHGIGKYVGIKQLEVDNIRKDYLLLEYAGEDRLYVPTEQISLVQKYLGAEGNAPKLYKLGGTDWSRVKQKVKASVQDMAKELVALYAARQQKQGFKFSEDTVWQKEFEEAFPFEETPDQLKSLDEIKRDMESTRPMDRLLCGDVGYGKTELAVRAACKAVMDGKQVAVLVPTTILAQQHYTTFKERFRGYPVGIEMLSRFKGPKEQADIIRKVKSGAVDIIIGTHRLVQEDVKLKDLGLVIIDEEQRFGVSHKEKLKKFKQLVDVLTLSATPIPRTLNMALTGARDMSILESPPEERFPVQTYVIEFNPEVVADAIRREIDRGGQVFFVHNRVKDIDKVARLIQDSVPEARITIAHGQMKEDELEQRMVSFIQQEYDVLICTTIIETGLDIPNVNTLIVDEAEKMGLAQLHQLRGRVGRSHRLAYAYFTYRKDKSLTEIAEKRLQAIREFTEFGSGFKIAMRDLEIRGAGNILGPEQHGHMATVGFDMYCRLLDEAVHELQGIEIRVDYEPTLDLNVNAFISDAYIVDQVTKIELYKRIMRISTKEDSEELEEELVDRFGDIPEQTLNLFSIARIKALCVVKGVESIEQQKDKVVISFLQKVDIRPQHLEPLTKRFARRITFSVGANFQIILNIKNVSEADMLSKIEVLLVELGQQVE